MGRNGCGSEVPSSCAVCWPQPLESPLPPWEVGGVITPFDRVPEGGEGSTSFRVSQLMGVRVGFDVGFSGTNSMPLRIAFFSKLSFLVGIGVVTPILLWLELGDCPFLFCLPLFASPLDRAQWVEELPVETELVTGLGELIFLSGLVTTRPPLCTHSCLPGADPNRSTRPSGCHACAKSGFGGTGETGAGE